MRSFVVLLLLLMSTSVGLAQDATSTATPDKGLRLMFLSNGALYQFDLQTQQAKPLGKSSGTIEGATITPDSAYMAYDSGAGVLRWLDTKTDETTVFHSDSIPTPQDAPKPRQYNAQPQVLRWSSDGKLLITQTLPDNRTRIGYTSLIAPYWIDLPPRPALPEATGLPADPDDYGCGTFDWSPDGSQLAFASGGPSNSACRFVSGLTIVDFKTKTSKRIVAREIAPDPTAPTTKVIAGSDDPSWSPDGQWIAFSMRIGIGHTANQNFVLSSLYEVRPTGENLTSLDDETHVGWAACPLWANKQLYYIRGTYTDNPANGYGELYKFDPATLQRSFVSSDVTCISNLSPDGRYAAITRGDGTLDVWSFEDKSSTFVTNMDPSADVKIAGWLPAA